MDLKWKIGLIASLLFLMTAAVRADENSSPELEEVIEKLREIDEDDERVDDLPILMEHDAYELDSKSAEDKVY